MDSATISSIIDLGFRGGFTITGVITVLIFLYVYKRTKSPHMVLAKLWLILNGDKECKDPVVKEFLDEQSALLQFQFMTGIHARTIDHVGRLRTWATQKGENIKQISACGAYFDIEKSDLLAKEKLPTGKLMALFSIGVTLLALLTLFSLGGVIYNRALLKMKDTGTFFSIDDKLTKPMGGPGFFLSKCNDVLATHDHPGFEPSDVAFICKWGQDKDSKAYIAETIVEQRWLAGIVAVFFGSLFLVLFRKTAQASEALAMQERVKNHVAAAPHTNQGQGSASN